MRSTPVTSCFLCGAGGDLVHDRVRDNLFGVEGQWSYRRCANRGCGLVWLDPKPLEDDLPLAYQHYYTHSDHGGDAFHGPVRRAVRLLEQAWLGALGLRSARRRIEAMYLDDMPPGRLLEVGCGDGARLAALRGLGWLVEGQEVDPKSAAQTRSQHEVVVHLGTLDELQLPSGRYDAVVMNHVLEHIHDPVQLLQECRRLLKPGGRFVATTPNPDSFGHRKFDRAWSAIDPPRHLHLFPTGAAADLARKAGFASSYVATSPARAGGLLASSRQIKRLGAAQPRGPVSPQLVLSAMWYQLLARAAFRRVAGSGEETVLRAIAT